MAKSLGFSAGSAGEASPTHSPRSGGDEDDEAGDSTYSEFLKRTDESVKEQMKLFKNAYKPVFEKMEQMQVQHATERNDLYDSYQEERDNLHNQWKEKVRHSNEIIKQILGSLGEGNDINNADNLVQQVEELEKKLEENQVEEKDLLRQLDDLQEKYKLQCEDLIAEQQKKLDEVTSSMEKEADETQAKALDQMKDLGQELGRINMKSFGGNDDDDDEQE